MIRSFRDKGTEKVFQRTRTRTFSLELQRIARRKLDVLDAADELGDLRAPPGNRLEKLAGERKNHYGIMINNQWRICFKWHNGDAYEVEIVDYH